MADNTQTTPFVKSLSNFLEKEITKTKNNTGQNLPCSVVSVDGPMVTVKFEIKSSITFPLVKVPQAISRYARPPIQVGDKGFLVSADASLYGVTNPSGTVSVYGREEANLSALVFMPLSNVSWPSVNANAYNITAPQGAIIKDDSSNSVITLTSSSITLSVGSNNIVINSSGISINGTLTINGSPYLNHKHLGVATGSGISGVVSP